MINSLVKEAATKKQIAMAVGNAAKSGKLDRFMSAIDTIVSADTANRSCYVWSCGADVELNLYLRNLDNFTDGPAVTILNQFEYMNPVDTKITESPEYFTKRITYVYNVGYFNDVPVRAEVIVELVVKSDSESCRRVLVGHKEATPQPIYKLECDPVESNVEGA
jgi:hypothetical protein